jgi:RNA polymerase sigma-70 factor (ECF subfamily)
MLRARRRTPTSSLPDRLEIEDFDAVDPGDALVSAQDGVAVRNSLAALPPEQRIAIEKAYFDGMTHTEIAAELQLPTGTVKSRLRLGLQKMRNLLSGEMV